MWGEFIAKQKPGAKIAELTFDNDFGKVYSTTMKQVASGQGLHDRRQRAARGHRHVDRQPDHQDPGVEPGRRARRDDRRVLPEADGRARGRRLQGHHDHLLHVRVGGIVLQAGRSGRQRRLPPSAAEGPERPAVRKRSGSRRSTRPTSRSTAPGADPNNGQILTGYDVGLQVVDTLTRAAAMDGGLTHENVMNAAWSTNFTLPLLLGGNVPRRRHHRCVRHRIRRRWASTTLRSTPRSRPEMSSTSKARAGSSQAELHTGRRTTSPARCARGLVVSSAHPVDASTSASSSGVRRSRSGSPTAATRRRNHSWRATASWIVGRHREAHREARRSVPRPHGWLGATRRAPSARGTRRPLRR